MKSKKLLEGLANIKSSIEESLDRERREWEEIPWYAQQGFIEDRDEELRLAAAELQTAEASLQNYKKGPGNKSKMSMEHIAEIDKLIAERKQAKPSMSEATARNNANKEYGKRHGKEGGFYSVRWLRDRLKLYRLSPPQ